MFSHGSPCHTSKVEGVLVLCDSCGGIRGFHEHEVAACLRHCGFCSPPTLQYCPGASSFTLARQARQADHQAFEATQAMLIDGNLRWWSRVSLAERRVRPRL